MKVGLNRGKAREAVKEIVTRRQTNLRKVSNSILKKIKILTETMCFANAAHGRVATAQPNQYPACVLGAQCVL